MAETLVSPGVLARENDQSQITAQPIQAGAAIVGPAVKGRVDRPTLVTSYSEYKANYGSTFTSGSNEYTYLTSIAAYNYFAQGGTSLLVTRVASGSLGQGLSVVLGAAHSKKLNNDDKLIFSLHGDGELQEGQNWEAIMYASAKKIDNIIATIDVNGQQIDGSTSNVLDIGNLRSKFEAFGWIVCEINKGNDIQSIIDGMNNAKSKTGNKKPVCVLLNTVMGNGVDFMMHTHEWHGKAPNDEQLEIALNQNPVTLGDY